MKVINWQQFLKSGLPLKKRLSSMTIGVFDGVHRGHQALLKRLVSHNADYVPVVVTFRENHKTIDNERKEIQNFRERLAAFERLGIQITIVIDFSGTFRKMPGIEFLEILLRHGCVGFFAAGNNFCCGYRLDTDAAAIHRFFASHNIPVEIVPEVMDGSLPISSSRIREAIAAGDIAHAETMLGWSNPELFQN